MDAPLYPASRVSNAEPSLDTRRVPDDGAVHWYQMDARPLASP